MIYTSYFAQVKNIPTNFVKVGISFIKPPWLDTSTFVWMKELAPTGNLLLFKKQNIIDEREYTQSYIMQLMDIDFEPIIKQLQSYENCVLLCYERSDAFCHRHILAKYLNSKFNLGITEFKK